MSHLDYRDVRTDDVSVGDLIAFDTLMARLSAREQETINRKIAFEVSEGEPASRRISVEGELENAEEKLEEVGEKLADLETERGALEQKIKNLQGDVRDLELFGEALQEQLTEAEARHGRELQEAEVRGYQRGKAERAA